MINKKKYSMSFTTTGLLRNETVTVVSLYLETRDWEQTHQRVKEDNALQMKTESSRRRVFAEIKSRLECLDDGEKKILCTSVPQDIDIVLWLALCRRYQFIGNFAKAVLREKYITLQRHIDFSDYNVFFEREATIHPEILDLKESTCQRLRLMLFQFICNCNLLDQKNMIQPVMFSPVIDELFKHGNQEETQYFPVIPKLVNE